MSYQVNYTKSFNGNLRELLRRGQKKVVALAQQAMTEAALQGDIALLTRTKHGESRLPNIEKFDVTDGHRLIVQLVDGEKKVRAFLFVGTHDDAERWLDNHKDYRWVRSATTGTLDFVRVTVVTPAHFPANRLDLESPEQLLHKPLLRVLSEEEWRFLALPRDAKTLAESVTANDYEVDPEGILARLNSLLSWNDAVLIIDLLHHAHSREWNELHRRLSLARGNAESIEGAAAAIAMTEPTNSESFVTFDDEETHAFFEKATLSEWMLFLHPEQKSVAFKELNGPTRLRGVSGSGKTCVIVHRARYLAKKYREPVALITLTESLRRLLDHLTGELCGVERALIESSTISAFARQIVHELHPNSSRYYSPLKPEQATRLIGDAVAAIRNHSDFPRTPLAQVPAADLVPFVRDEISYIRGRLPELAMEQYLDTKTFQRRGRRLALNEVARRVVLAGVTTYTARMRAMHTLDHEGVVADALTLLQQNRGSNMRRYRAVLVDEVQDLSHMELALLANLTTPAGAPVASAQDGLFLAGDGAQTIYKRGFTLRSLGIEVGGRNYTLKKNYRNTHEILKAAFGLIEKYEFADVDEEHIVKPGAPEFAKRHGRRPVLLRCESTQEEGQAVAAQISSLIAMGHIPGQICVIGPSNIMRDAAKEFMSKLGILHTDLRDDIDFESDRVKVSTIESAKGHEFGAVFVMGLVEKVLPHSEVSDEEMHREAARLYVAMTRARENLYLTYSPSRGHQASRFLFAIQNDCDEARYRDGEWSPVHS